MEVHEIQPKEFALFQAFIFQQAGISMAESKRPLVAGRLAKRLKHYGFATYKEYYNLIQKQEYAHEKQVAVNLLTTNETHFFREPKHFDFLRDTVLPNVAKGRSFRVWSAASSSGEEVYTLAMLLAEHVPNQPWELIGSDISTAVLEKAKTGSYPLQRASEIPVRYLQKYCLKGVGEAAGTMLISKALRQRVHFQAINLIEPYPELGLFDVIFLRNVMIYFNQDTKRDIVTRILDKLRPGGLLFISHSESLNGVVDGLKVLAPAVYQKTGGI